MAASTQNPTIRTTVIKFIVSLFLGLSAAYFLKEPGFTDSQVYVLFLLVFAVGLWFTEAIPAFAVGLFILAFLVYALGNKNFNSAPEKIDVYVNTFSSSIIWLMLGGFFIASAMTKTKLDETLIRFTIRLSGDRPQNLLIGLMTTIMFASMLMSNTATAAMAVACLSPLLNNPNIKPQVIKALLLGVTIGAATGGMATIIGTPPNLIAAGALENAGMPIDFLEWMKFGLPLTFALTAICCIVLIRVYLKNADRIQLDISNDKTAFTPELKRQRTIVIIIAIITVVMWLTSELHGISVPAVSAIPIVFLTLMRILQGKDVQSLPWDTLLLVAGGLSLGVALQRTGLMAHYAGKLSGLGLSETGFILILGFLTMVLSNIMSHTATSSLLIPLGLSLLPEAKTEAALVIALCSSTAMFLPVSTPPNAIVYSTGKLEQKDFRTAGVVLGILGPLIIIGWIMLIK